MLSAMAAIPTTKLGRCHASRRADWDHPRQFPARRRDRMSDGRSNVARGFSGRGRPRGERGGVVAFGNWSFISSSTALTMNTLPWASSSSSSASIGRPAAAFYWIDANSSAMLFNSEPFLQGYIFEQGQAPNGNASNQTARSRGTCSRDGAGSALAEQASRGRPILAPSG